MTFAKPETQPEAGERETFVVRDHLNELLILSDYSVKHDFPSSFGVGGVTSAIIADTIVADGPNAGKLYGQTAILGAFLVKDINAAINEGKTEPILARLIQLPPKPMKKGAYVFRYDYTAAEATAAEGYLKGAHGAAVDTEVPF